MRALFLRPQNGIDRKLYTCGLLFAAARSALLFAGGRVKLLRARKIPSTCPAGGGCFAIGARICREGGADLVGDGSVRASAREKPLGGQNQHHQRGRAQGARASVQGAAGVGEISCGSVCIDGSRCARARGRSCGGSCMAGGRACQGRARAAGAAPREARPEKVRVGWARLAGARLSRAPEARTERPLPPRPRRAPAVGWSAAPLRRADRIHQGGEGDAGARGGKGEGGKRARSAADCTGGRNRIPHEDGER